ncbi:unnamed protein product [Allacma fusca]|uniref:C2H2-type domain-containing protein n=1 Tax=Allacma fusca TaxID=39272 RepID=A0A8J2LIG3_9HEXA|nr:unnamed protein product [Allacma fusca]
MRFECTYKGCDRVFKYVGNLEYHINIHKNTKPYQCGKCNAAFRNASHLRVHEAKAHTDNEWEKPSSLGHRTKLKKPAGNINGGDKTSSALSKDSLKEKARLLCVQIRPEDLNQVRKYRQLKESLFWKMSMHHLFMVPFSVINPAYSKTPTRLSFELRVIHDTNLFLNRANCGWESALTTSSESASNNNAVNDPAVQHSEVISNQVSMEPTLNVRFQAFVHPTSSHSQDGPRDYRLCPYCKKALRRDRYHVHLATHKGHCFRFQKCMNCSLRFLISKRFSEHLKQHSETTQQMVNNEYLYIGMPRFSPAIL